MELTNTELNKLKSAAKNNTKKNLQDEELPHELFLTTRQETKIRNAFTNNMWKDIKLNESLLNKIIQSAEFLDKTSVLDKFEKNWWRRCCKSRKRIYFIYFK